MVHSGIRVAIVFHALFASMSHRDSDRERGLAPLALETNATLRNVGGVGLQSRYSDRDLVRLCMCFGFQIHLPM